MKKILFMALSLVFFACNGPQNNDKPSNKTEEFKVNFSVKDSVGGTLTAKIKDGDSITTGNKVAKDKEVVFTATPTDATYSIESWTLDGTPVEDAKLKNDKKECTLKITKEVNLSVKFKKNENSPTPTENEFTVNFSVKDSVGGTLTAKIKDGDSITTGKKVAKDKDVVFTATPDATYSIESWTLDGTPVAETELKKEKTEYTLKIAKEVNLIVKFKKNPPKDIQIQKVILGNPHISDRDGKEVKGEDLNENKTIDDFEVPSPTFPIMVYHKTEFTNEKVFVTCKGAKAELTNSVTNAYRDKEYTLVENEKTLFVVDIEGEGYNPLKLTFNVTYKRPVKKYVDEITTIAIVTNKANATTTYGGQAHSMAELTGGKTTIDVFRNDPKMTISLNEVGAQPKAEIKLDGNIMAGKNFEAGEHSLEVQFDSLSAGKHHIEIKIEKEGYEPGNYDFYIQYKNQLNFKSITIGDKTYNDASQAKQITIPADAPNPINISGEVDIEGATVFFKKKEGTKWKKITSLSINEGANLNLQMHATLDGCTPLKFEFKVKKEQKEAIVFDKIEIDDNVVNDAIEVTKAEAKVKIAITLNKKYEGISFEINDVANTPEFNATNTVATFNNFAITENGSLSVKIKASAPNYSECEKTITITHKNQTQSATYIDGGSISSWDAEADEGNGEFNAPAQLVQDGKNWKVALTESGPYEIVIRINKNEKDITDISKFKISIKDVNTNKVYLEKKPATRKVNNEKVIFQYSKDQENRDILFQSGKNDLIISIYYENEVVETTHLEVTR